MPSPSSYGFPRSQVLYFLLGSPLVIYLRGSTSQQGHRKRQMFLQVGADMRPKTGTLKGYLRSRNQLFIFGGLNLDLQQYLGLILRVILNHSSPSELFDPQLHFNSECQSLGGVKGLLESCLVCPSIFTSAYGLLTWLIRCRKTGSQEQGTVGLLRRFCSARVPQARIWPRMAASSE